jgi:hypothetical protein
MNPFEAQAGLDFGLCDPQMRKRPANHAKTTRQNTQAVSSGKFGNNF